MQKKPILRFHSKWVCDMCVIHLIFIHLKCDTESLADGRAVVRGFYNEQNNMVNSIYYAYIPYTLLLEFGILVFQFPLIYNQQ